MELSVFMSSNFIFMLIPISRAARIYIYVCVRLAQSALPWASFCSRSVFLSISRVALVSKALHCLRAWTLSLCFSLVLWSFITYVFACVSFFPSVLLPFLILLFCFELFCFFWLLQLLRMLGFGLWIYILSYTFSVARAIEQVHCTAFRLLRNDVWSVGGMVRSWYAVIGARHKPEVQDSSIDVGVGAALASLTPYTVRQHTLTE